MPTNNQQNTTWNKEKTEALLRRRIVSRQGGGTEKVLIQHKKNKLTARERLAVLFDENSFYEINSLTESRCSDFEMDKMKVLGDGIITGYGKINGVPVFASSQDFTVLGGSLGEYHAKKICRIIDLALSAKAPYIAINDSGGARIQEGVDSLNGYGDIFYRHINASGVIPQISVIMGPCAGGACYAPALSDFIFMVKNTSFMFITGPQVVRTVTGEKVSAEDLGGAEVHDKISGVAHFIYEDDIICLYAVRKLLSYLPQNNKTVLPITEGFNEYPTENLRSIVPDNPKKSYDIKAVIKQLADKTSFIEIHKNYAQNVVIGLGKIKGHTIGFIANQPSIVAGALDTNASDKIARFIRFCDCFNIPLLTLVDVPGFLPGIQQEHQGIIRHGAKILYAYTEASVPKVTVILRKAYGGAYIAMCSKGLGADFVYAWPTAEIAVMGAESAVNILEQNTELTKEQFINKITEYENTFLNPYIAAARGYIDEVILPEETKERIMVSFDILKTRKISQTEKKHGNIPL